MIDYHEARALDFLGQFKTSELPRTGAPGTYHMDNGWFGFADAYALQGIARYYEPSAIIEVGCGWSSLLIGETTNAHHLCIDPQPRIDVSRFDFINEPVQILDLGTFDALNAGDILFIDTSHVFFRNSELYYIFFQVLPALRPGVIIQFHDIFLPWDYPPQWITDGYNEQYILQALLMGGNNYEVIFPVHLMCRHHPDEIMAKFSLTSTELSGASMWLEKKGLT